MTATVTDTHNNKPQLTLPQRNSQLLTARVWLGRVAAFSGLLSEGHTGHGPTRVHTLFFNTQPSLSIRPKNLSENPSALVRASFSQFSCFRFWREFAPDFGRRWPPFLVSNFPALSDGLGQRTLGRVKIYCLDFQDIIIYYSRNAISTSSGSF